MINLMITHEFFFLFDCSYVWFDWNVRMNLVKEIIEVLKLDGYVLSSC